MLYWNCSRDKWHKSLATKWPPGKGRGTVHPGGRMPPRCRVISGVISPVGCQGTTLPIHPPKDVCACCWIQVEESREVNLLQLQAWSPKAGPRGRCICCPAGRVPNLQGRNREPLPSSIHAQEVTWTPTVWAEIGTRCNEGHFVFLEDHLRQRRDEQPGGSREPEPTSTCPSCHWDRASQRERQDTSGEQELTKAREAHQQALAATAALEEQIERLSRSTTRARPDICFHSQSQDQPRRRSWGQSLRCCRPLPEEGSPAWSPTCSLTGSPWWVTFLDPETLEEDQAAGQPSAGLDLGPSPKLEPDIECFLQEPVTTQEEGKGSDVSQEPSVEDYEKWIEWRRCQVHTPNWWWELVGIPGINDFQELIQKIRAFFETSQAKSKDQNVNNNYLAPPAPKCICQKELIPLSNPTFPSQEFREGESQKTLPYMQALQYWAEKASLPMLGQPCFLARCVQELRQVMKPYVTFPDDVILEGAAP